MLFNPLRGPQGAWLSPAFREAFSARRPRPFPPLQVLVPSAGCVETPRLPEPAPQGQNVAPRSKYPPKASRAPSLPACPLCGWVRRPAGRRRDAVRCQPMVKAVSGEAALSRASAGLLSPAPHDPRQGCRARLLGRSAPLLGRGSSPVLWQTSVSPAAFPLPLHARAGVVQPLWGLPAANQPWVPA